MTANPKQWRHNPDELAQMKWHQMTTAQKIAARKFDLHPPKSQRDRHLRKTYNITEADYEALSLAQGDKCAICNTKWRKTLFVDHSHETGVVRGLLCAICNSLVGYVETTSPNTTLRLLGYLFPHLYDKLKIDEATSAPNT